MPTQPEPIASPWFPFVKTVSAPRFRLFCFPHAGGSASIYRTWRNRLAPGVECWAVQLPARATRLSEPPLLRMGPLVETVLAQLKPFLDVPFALFGHSMGGLISFELTRALAARGGPLPKRLLVSSYQAPHLPGRHPLPHDRPEPEFIARLKALKGTPAGVLEEPELRALVMPTLRADFELIHTYAPPPQAALPVPISTFGAVGDDEVFPEDLRAWEAFSAPGFRSRLFPGDHFYLVPQEATLVTAVQQDLALV